jgi:hypothetical protein
MSYAQKILFFFYRKCGDYHEKTHPHYKAQEQRSYRSRKAKGAARPEQHAQWFRIVTEVHPDSSHRWNRYRIQPDSLHPDNCVL